MKFGEIWRGEAMLAFNESKLEETAKLKPVNILGGYYLSIGFTIEGGKVLHKYL